MITGKSRWHLDHCKQIRTLISNNPQLSKACIIRTHLPAKIPQKHNITISFEQCPILVVIFDFVQWKFEFTSLNQILKFILYIYLNRNWKMFWSEQILLVLGQRTGVHCEDCLCVQNFIQWSYFNVKQFHLFRDENKKTA
jgi:hypothetical protein